ncbi:glycoside hydrolase family 11 protein [Sorangium sp. So ce542]|uniref:glycoside hydrolase family 11 protein n=1 Tax=Sorangium sp. So ce542 TaxID=3133316 RepID=UPI003F61F271
MTTTTTSGGGGSDASSSVTTGVTTSSGVTTTSASGTGGSDGTGGADATTTTTTTTTTSATTSSSATGGMPAACTEPDREVCNNGTNMHCGYTYEYWKDSGSGCLTNTSEGFSVNWSNINNLLGRKGIRPGSKDQIVTYEADYRPNGNSYLCVYGWTKGPLVEYYIVDSWGTWRPPGGEGHMGTVESDGGTYDIYRTQRVNQPSIEGTATFYQFWSVRKDKRSSGTITVANHFNAWASKGMNMGNLYEVSMTVEGYQSSGEADVKFSME